EGSVIVSGLTNGQVYRVRVYSWSATTQTAPTFNICVTTPPATPVNDACAGAVTITQQSLGNCTLTTGTVLGATQTTATCTGSGTADVWYRFVATSTSAVIRRTASFDSVLQVMTACGSGSLGCFDDEADQTITGLTVGTTYFYRILPFSSTAPSTPDFTTCVTTPCTNATNNECATAITLTHQPRNACSDFTACLTNATQSQATCTGSMTANDVWFKFVATKDSAIIHRVAGFNNIIQAFSGVCGSLTSLNCYYPSGSSGQQADLLLTGLTVGQTYTFRLYADVSTIPSSPSFTVCVTSPTNVNNTSCNRMNPICTSNTITFQAQTGGTSEAGNNYGCLATQPNPTWFYLQIGTSGSLNFTVSASADVDYALWGPYTTLPLAKAACGTLPNPIACSYSTAKIENINIASGTTGQVYVLLVTNFANRLQIINLFQTGGTGTSDCAIVLGENLSDFYGNNQNTQNTIHWEVNPNQQNVKFFEILKSKDINSFVSVGNVDFSAEKSKYNFVDKQADCGTNYYQLKFIHHNNTTSTSPIIYVRRASEECDKSIVVYPNPFENHLKIHLEDIKPQEISYILEDMTGKIIQKSVIFYNNEDVNIMTDKVPKGVYMLQINTNEKIKRQKIVKN
ncbi:MAG: T9SS C-terminal target domain-containing protein, partial [Bacteroidetes bacterium]